MKIISSKLILCYIYVNIEKFVCFRATMSQNVGGGTPRAEAMLEERRRVLRNALKSEFLRKKYNPANYNADGGMEFY